MWVFILIVAFSQQLFASDCPGLNKSLKEPYSDRVRSSLRGCDLQVTGLTEFETLKGKDISTGAPLSIKAAVVQRIYSITEDCKFNVMDTDLKAAEKAGDSEITKVSSYLFFPCEQVPLKDKVKVVQVSPGVNRLRVQTPWRSVMIWDQDYKLVEMTGVKFKPETKERSLAHFTTPISAARPLNMERPSNGIMIDCGTIKGAPSYLRPKQTCIIINSQNQKCEIEAADVLQYPSKHVSVFKFKDDSQLKTFLNNKCGSEFIYENKWTRPKGVVRGTEKGQG